MSEVIIAIYSVDSAAGDQASAIFLFNVRIINFNSWFHGDAMSFFFFCIRIVLFASFVRIKWDYRICMTFILYLSCPCRPWLNMALHIFHSFGALSNSLFFTIPPTLCSCPVICGCRIRWPHLCRRVRPSPIGRPGYDNERHPTAILW